MSSVASCGVRPLLSVRAGRPGDAAVSHPPHSLTSPLLRRHLRYAVLGAGFAGLSVVYHLLKHSHMECSMQIDLYDESGIGGGASGISGGLLHPYSPKGKLLWMGAECWRESLMLLSVAESFANLENNDFIVRRRGIMRPVTNVKSLDALNTNAQNCDAGCRIEALEVDAVQNIFPNIQLPCSRAFYMPDAVNVNPLRYLQALYLACESLVEESSSSGAGQKELHLHKKSVQSLSQFEGKYDAVVVCLGATANFLPELSGRLPLRTCRGVVAQMELLEDIREHYPDHAPSLLSDAWLAVQGSRSFYMGSTWEWGSRNSSPFVSENESSKALAELLPKASVFYPGIKDWNFTSARAGLRAMPPLTPYGSLPLLGCVNDIIDEKFTSQYWLLGGLGSRGLLYHALLGKLLAQAVLSCNESLIPSELTSWKNVKR